MNAVALARMCCLSEPPSNTAGIYFWLMTWSCACKKTCMLAIQLHIRSGWLVNTLTEIEARVADWLMVPSFNGEGIQVITVSAYSLKPVISGGILYAVGCWRLECRHTHTTATMRVILNTRAVPLQVLKYEDGQKYGELAEVSSTAAFCLVSMSCSVVDLVVPRHTVYAMQIRTLTTASTRCGAAGKDSVAC